MLKKLLGLFAVLFLGFTMTLPNATNAASNSSLTKEEIQTLTNLKKDLKASSQKIQQLIRDGKEKEVESIPEVQNAKKILEKNPRLYTKFVSEMEAASPKAQDTLGPIKLGANEKKIVQFEDGSFLVVSQSQPQQVSAACTMCPIDATDDYKLEIWGFYKQAELHLITEYSIWYGYSGVNVRNVYSTWWTNWGSTISSSSTFTDVASGDYIQTKGTFVHTVGTGSATSSTTWVLHTHITKSNDISHWYDKYAGW